MLAQVQRELGPVDVFVHNAGVARSLPLEAIHVATWDATFAVNLRAAFIVSSAVIPSMRARRWGRLLYISSTAALQSAASSARITPRPKRAFEGLMLATTSLLAKDGITANAIAPALIETAMIAGNPAAVPRAAPGGPLWKAGGSRRGRRGHRIECLRHGADDPDPHGMYMT